MNRPPPEECANCGAPIPHGAKACPECGADERTGWRENDATRYDGLDLPEEAFADDDKAKSGPNRKRERPVSGVAWYWWCVGIALVVVLVLGGLRLL